MTTPSSFMDECLSCLAVTGKRPISPGPFVYVGKYWVVDHAYPTALEGWLVLVLRRHAEALHDLTDDEFRELAIIQSRTARALHDELQCEKEYMAFFAEARGAQHVHIHMIPKPYGLPDDLKGPGVFGLLKVDRAHAISCDEIVSLCVRLQARMSSDRVGSLVGDPDNVSSEP